MDAQGNCIKQCHWVKKTAYYNGETIIYYQCSRCGAIQ